MTPPTEPADRCHVEVDAVLFDLDGVLVDSTGAVEQVWRGFAVEHGLDPDQLLEDLHGRRMVDIVARALPHLSSEGLAQETARVDAAEAAGAHETAVLPGARRLLADLSERRVPWAVATSATDAVARARLEVLGAPPSAVVVTADQVARGKPDPDPYLAAAGRLGVDPRRCLVIEDAPAGVRAGNAAGAVTVALSTSHRPDQLTHADHQLDTLVGLELVGTLPTSAVALRCQRHADGPAASVVGPGRLR